MLTQQLNSVSSYLTFARPAFVLSTFAAAVLSTVARGETTLEMTNRICERYFGVNRTSRVDPARKKFNASAPPGAALFRRPLCTHEP
jgi:hypothetical protein